MGSYYFLMTMLPRLPSALGQPLGADMDWLADKARQNIDAADRPVLEAYLLYADLVNFVGRKAGRKSRFPGGRLTADEIDNQKKLPEAIGDFLKGQAKSRPYVYDSLWERYFTWALGIAEKHGCRFLKDYFTWEIQLRNRLTALRAVAQGLKPEDYLVAPSIVLYNFDRLISGLRDRSEPLEAEMYLDGERLKHISDFLDYDVFSLDALLGYLSRAYIFYRWQNAGRSFDLEKITFVGGVE